MNPRPEASERRTFRRADRLTHDLEYKAVFAARCRKARGPLVLLARPNGLDHSRLGLSVGRRVGGAVVRNRVKRLLREAFRLERAALPAGYDFIASPNAHAPMPLASYRRLLVELASETDRVWRKRAGK